MISIFDNFNHYLPKVLNFNFRFINFNKDYIYGNNFNNLVNLKLFYLNFRFIIMTVHILNIVNFTFILIKV